MALKLTNPEVEELVPRDRKQEVLRRLEEEIWSLIPPEQLARVPSQEEQDEILGYGPAGER